MKAIIIYFISLTFATLVCGQTSTTTVEKDIVYRTVDNWEGKLDLYYPDHDTKNALVFYVHGGGWTHGSKNNEYDKIKVFIDEGYTVANIGYRVASQAVAPAAVEDVQCALVYLIENAEKYHIDKEKIILIGGSAGAHLALLVGLQSPAPVYGCMLPSEVIKVSGIISKYGPTDVRTWRPATDTKKASSTWLGDKINDSIFMASLSPISYVSPQTSDIAVLFIHGADDQTVPVEQSVTMYNKLIENKNATELHVVQKGKHGNFAHDDTEIMNQKMIRFIADCLDR